MSSHDIARGRSQEARDSALAAAIRSILPPGTPFALFVFEGNMAVFLTNWEGTDIVLGVCETLEAMLVDEEHRDEDKETTPGR